MSSLECCKCKKKMSIWENYSVDDDGATCIECHTLKKSIGPECECGMKKTQHAKLAKAHSPWCPWREWKEKLNDRGIKQ